MNDVVVDSSGRRRRTILLWILAIIAALVLDRWVPNWMIPHRDYVKNHSEFFEECKELGTIWVTLAAAIILGVLHASRWRASVLVCVSAVIGGLIEFVMKWSVGRTRPVASEVVDIAPFTLHPFRGGWSGIAQQSNLCFPSGHTLLAFSTAACLAYLCPRGRWLWFLGATLVAAERVVEVAHYPSDVVGAALFGVIASQLARRLLHMREPERLEMPIRSAATA